MSKITVHNYEAFLLDHLEGRLESSLTEELKQFALSHPELEIDLAETSLPYISGFNVEADFKEDLKKKEEPLEDEELLSYLEGLMDKEERKRFERKISRTPDLKKALGTYRKTLLQVDPEELFAEKNALLKTEDDFILSDRTIAYVEDQLTGEEKSGFEKQLEYDGTLRKDLLLTSKTVLIAENEIVYPDRASLKKETRVFVLYRRKTLLRAAAAVFLLSFLAFTFNYLKTGVQPENGISKKNKPVKNKRLIPGDNRSLNKENTSGVKEDSNSLTGLANLNGSPGKNKNVPVKPENESGAEVRETNNDPEKIKEDQPAPVKQQEQNSEIRQLAEVAQEQINNSVNTAVDSNNSVTYKITELATVEEGSEEEFYLKSSQKEEKGLWKRAVQLAQRANKLGVKSVDGVEDSRNKQYRISFNSFSVEKK